MMSDAHLDPPLVRMPPLDHGRWLNTAEPLPQKQLHGRVVLIDFWDYACVNCVRTLPYLREWHRRYATHGLTIIGIHTPEFSFGSNEAQVQRAIDEFELPYPVLLDSEQENWTRFANRAWPTKYLVDAQGYIRLKRQGEGYYAALETAVQTLLRQHDPELTLPDPLPPLRPEDRPGAVCYRPTPELYAGYQGGGLFGGALGNAEGYVTDAITLYALPQRARRAAGQFYVEGFWQARPEALAHAGENGGRILLPYAAAGVNAVLSPSGDAVELLLDLRPSTQPPLVEVRLDGSSLSRSEAGADVVFDGDGRSFLHVTRPRMFRVTRHQTVRPRELALIFRARGLALYSFTFDTCIAPPDADDPAALFTRH